MSVGEIISGLAASKKDICIGDVIYAVDGDILESHSSGLTPHQVLMRHACERPIEFLLVRASALPNPNSLISNVVCPCQKSSVINIA